MLFKMNHQEANSGFDIIPEGAYEAVITEVEITESKAGNPMLKLTVTIRDDVDQGAKKRKIWDYLVATEKTMFKFHQVGKSVGIPDGQVLSSLEHFRDEILFKPVMINIIHEKSVYGGEQRVNARIRNYDNATVPFNGSGSNNPFSLNEELINITDDEFPF